MKRKVKLSEERLNRWGYFFVLPFVLVYFIFHFYPTIYTFLLAFTDLKGLQTSFSFIGLQNFNKLVHDPYFWGALRNTFIIWGYNFVPQLGIALILAVWFTDLRLNLKGRNLFRAVVYMPNLLTAASVALLFRSLFGYPVGPVNQFLQGVLGLYQKVERDGKIIEEAFNFFRNVTVTRSIVAFIQWWMWYGHTLIMLMAGITSISPTLFESALVDGANNRQTTWNITLPLLRPMMLYILITSMIGGMQMLDIPFLLTDMRGAPDNKIRTTTVYLFNVGFQGRNDYAYAAAISIGVFIITVILALLIFFFIQDRSELKQTSLEKRALKLAKKGGING
jgi:multiple sugar transport system permease protein